MRSSSNRAYLAASTCSRSFLAVEAETRLLRRAVDDEAEPHRLPAGRGVEGRQADIAVAIALAALRKLQHDGPGVLQVEHLLFPVRFEKIPEIIDAQEADIRRIKPEIRKRFRYWRRPPEKEHESGSDESKVRKPDNDFAPDAQGFMDDKVNVLDLLHALVQNDIIKTIIRIFAQAVFNIVV